MADESSPKTGAKTRPLEFQRRPTLSRKERAMLVNTQRTLGNIERQFQDFRSQVMRQLEKILRDIERRIDP